MLHDKRPTVECVHYISINVSERYEDVVVCAKRAGIRLGPQLIHNPDRINGSIVGALVLYQVLVVLNAM